MQATAPNIGATGFIEIPRQMSNASQARPAVPEPLVPPAPKAGGCVITAAKSDAKIAAKVAYTNNIISDFIVSA